MLCVMKRVAVRAYETNSKQLLYTGKFYIGKGSTLGKCIISNLFHAFRNNNGGECRALKKSIPFNICHTIRNCDRNETRIIESSFLDFSHAFGNDNSS